MRRAVLAGLAVLAAAAPATAQERRFDTLDMGELAKLMRGWGYPASAYITDAGWPEIGTEMHGVDVQVQFYDCDEAKQQRCGELELSAAFPAGDRLSLEQINDWNAQWRYNAAYKSETSVYLRIDILLLGGTAESGLREQFAIFDAAIADFLDLLEE